MLRELRTRTNEAHISTKLVEKLGQLVQFPATQERAYRGKELVSASGDRRTVRNAPANPHCAELDDDKGTPIAADALLNKQDWSTEGETHGKANDHKCRDKLRQTAHDTSPIKQVLTDWPVPRT
jgi:hypothetical protein